MSRAVFLTLAVAGGTFGLAVAGCGTSPVTAEPTGDSAVVNVQREAGTEAASDADAADFVDVAMSDVADSAPYTEAGITPVGDAATTTCQSAADCAKGQLCLIRSTVSQSTSACVNDPCDGGALKAGPNNCGCELCNSVFCNADPDSGVVSCTTGG
jgi:hypothetical protein